MIASLAPDRAALARETLAWCDAFWDDERALSWAPTGAGVGRVHLVPQSAWYAYGLLARGVGDDTSKAVRCLRALLELQYDEPGTAWHGSFARWAEAPHPAADAVMWEDYDPNWRQFLGTTFIALLQDFETTLGPALAGDMDRALRLTVEGEPDTRVPASYSNIALMKAFLAVEAGRRLGEESWIRRGEALANEIADGFEALGAFEEYNSPTYYGIDFHALALWGERSSSARLRDRGRALEAALWRDVARWYHAGLRNLCGPYSRTYGMDMTRYMALLGLQIWAGVGRDAAPVPGFAPAVDHGHDYFLGPLTAVLGARVPADARAALLDFPGPHGVAQRVAAKPRRHATGWLDDGLMIGAEQNETDAYAGWAQYVAASIHWKLPDGNVGWIAARSLGPPHGVAGEGTLSLEVRPGCELRLTIHAPEAAADAFAGRRWQLPGLQIDVSGELTMSSLARSGDVSKLVFQAAGNRAARVTLACVASNSPPYSK